MTAPTARFARSGRSPLKKSRGDFLSELTISKCSALKRMGLHCSEAVTEGVDSFFTQAAVWNRMRVPHIQEKEAAPVLSIGTAKNIDFKYRMVYSKHR